MDIHTRLHEFISQLLQEHGYRKAFDDDQSLILSGLLDSLAVIHIVVFMEKEFGVDFSEVYFDQDQFDSINLMVKFIQEHQA